MNEEDMKSTNYPGKIPGRRGIHDKNVTYTVNMGNMDDNNDNGTDTVDNGTDTVDNAMSKPVCLNNENYTNGNINDSSIETVADDDDSVGDDNDTSVHHNNANGTVRYRNVHTDINNPYSRPKTAEKDEAVRDNNGDDDDERPESATYNFPKSNSFQNNSMHKLNRSGSSRSIVQFQANYKINNALNIINKNKSICFCIGLLLFFIIWLLCHTLTNNAGAYKDSIDIEDDRSTFISEVASVGRKYNVSSESMFHVQNGIETIFKKHDTGSFIFTYDRESKSFDHAIFNKFMEDITVAASRYLRHYNNDINNIIFDTSQKISFISHGEFMRKYKKNVEEVGVFFIKDIDNLPSSLAMAFHYYCDEYNPLVKKSAIFFTFDVSRCSFPTPQKTMHTYIERCLKEKWIDIGIDKIGPLLTRIVNVIVDVRHS